MDSRPITAERAEAVRAILRAWNQTGTRYAIIHGLEGYPDRIGRDLDAIIRDEDVYPALQIASRILEQRGYTVAYPPNVWGERIVAFASGGTNGADSSLEIHTVTTLSWGIVLFAKGPEFALREGEFITDPWASFVKRILLPLLNSGVRRFVDTPYDLTLNEEERKIASIKLSRYFGELLTEEFLSSLKSQNLSNLDRLLPTARRTALVNSLISSPIATLLNSLRWGKKKVRQYVTPCAPIIAFVGPDGVGKSTLTQHLQDKIPRVFTGIVVRHWRPGLFPSLGSFLGRACHKAGHVSPRREPGGFHWLRLLYYLFDFWIGYWIKDIKASSRQQVVIYDRCALDMVVDPVRYGLSSSRGTRLLWKIIPKPHIIILLYDEPENVFARKGELTNDEIDRQLKDWLELAEEGLVTSMVRVDREPTQIAKQVRDLFVEVFVRENRDSFSVRRSLKNRLASVVPLITTDSGEVQYRVHNYFGDQNQEHEQWNKVSEFAIVPGSSAPRLLVPTRPLKAAAASMHVYNPQRSWAKCLKWLLVIGLRGGVAPLFLGDRISLYIRSDISNQDWKDHLMEECLREFFHVRRLSVAIALGTPGPHQKPVLQVMDHEGEVRGYVKVGWNRATMDLVQNEESFLRRLEDVHFPRIQIPRVLQARYWGDLFFVIQEPPKGDRRSGSQQLSSLHVEFLYNLFYASSDVSTCPLELSHFWNHIKRRIAYIGQLSGVSHYYQVLEGATILLEEWTSSVSLPFGTRHGDFAPWNTWFVKGDLFVFDWEYASDLGPPAWDLFHFVIQSATLISDSEPAQIYRELLSRDSRNHIFLHEYLSYLGLETRLAPALLLIYLVDVLSASLVLNNRVVDQKTERLREVWRHLIGLIRLNKELGYEC